MSSLFESYIEFDDTLKEVDMLIALAKAQDKELVYPVINKCSILLLIAKFESFIESIADEYILLFNNGSPNTNNISDRMKLNHTLCALNNIADLKQEHKLSEAIEIFKKISHLWHNDGIFKEINIETGFSFGKHGQNEIKKIFRNIDCEDVLADIVVLDRNENMLESTTTIDIFGEIDSLVNIRNNIIHEDATPNLTHHDIVRFRYYLSEITMQIADKMKNKLLARNLIKA